MTYEVYLRGDTIKIKPSNEVEEILQNVRCLLMTELCTVPMYREFGLDVKMLDRSLNAAQAEFTSNVAIAISKWEPRARLQRVRWEESDAVDGILEPVVTVELRGD